MKAFAGGTGGRNVAEIVRISYANANNLVKELADLQLLVEKTGQRRNRVFAYDCYLDIFADS